MKTRSGARRLGLGGLAVLGFACLVPQIPFGDAGAQEIIALSWNDLGMHCMNQDHHTISILPPFNTLEAQLIARGEYGTLPEIVADGYTIEYSVPGNTYSAGKTDFWDYVEQIYGLAGCQKRHPGPTARCASVPFVTATRPVGRARTG